MRKFKKLNKKDYELLETLYKNKYLDLNYIQKYIFITYESRRHLLRKLRSLINEGLIVNYINVQNKYDDIDSVIYALTEDGYNLIHYKYDRYNYDPISQVRLKQGYEHTLIMIHILQKYKIDDGQSLIFNESESFQKLSEKKHEVVRPDGVIINKNKSLIVIEYEHSNLRRDLFYKLTRYNDYFVKKLYKQNYSFGEYSINNAILHLVTNGSLSEKAIKRIKLLDLKYIVSSCTAKEMLDDPTNPNNYRVISTPRLI